MSTGSLATPLGIKDFIYFLKKNGCSSFKQFFLPFLMPALTSVGSIGSSLSLWLLPGSQHSFSDPTPSACLVPLLV